MDKNLKTGYIYGLAAFVFWGFVPIYFKKVSHINAFEVLAHRIVWSVALLFILLVALKQFKAFVQIFKEPKKMMMLFLSATLVSINWVIFIWAVGHDKIIETSFGYFINPLVMIAFGYIFFHERLQKYQIICVSLAILGVVYQAIAIGFVPLVSLGLAFSFGFYGLVRKKIGVSSMPGLMMETLLISPIALIYLYTLDVQGVGHFRNDMAMLIFAGFVTVVPLIWFNIAASKLPYSTIGFLQYIGPTIAFLIAILYYHEPFTTHKLISFIIIWIALAIYSYNFINKKEQSNELHSNK